MSKKRAIKLVQLYPRLMNIYGDNGNLLTMRWRLKKHGFDPQVVYVHRGEKIPADTDIIISGGGQDSGQLKVEDDLKKTKKKDLLAMHDDGVTMLAVCGMYQLMGHYFETGDGSKIEGTGVLDVTTKAGDERLIGNIVLNTEWGQMVGFENHSGETSLGNGAKPLGEVVKGAGNSRENSHEGAVSKNVFATYLHGPVLPKNPDFADALIVRAVQRRYGIDILEQLDDTLASQAASIHAKRPR